MSNDRAEAAQAAAKREADLYLYLADRFGWTPSEIEKIPQHVLSAMAQDLANDKRPAEDAPVEPEPLAEWERELLATQATAATTGGSMGMDFGEAIRYLKAGERVYRMGWNGKGMWLAFEDTTRWPNSKMQPFIYMHTADGSLVPWVASQTDILATDWLIRFERPTPEANRWLNDVRIEGRGVGWSLNRLREEVGEPPLGDAAVPDGLRTPEPTPTAPAASTTTSDGVTLTVHLDGRVIYDAIRPHIQNARQIERLRNGHAPI